jgi:hypothetical protein
MEKVNYNLTISKLLLSSYSINDHYNKNYVKLDPVLKSIFYNTVEGSRSIRRDIPKGASVELFSFKVSDVCDR